MFRSIVKYRRFVVNQLNTCVVTTRNDSASQTVSSTAAGLLGGHETCAKWARDRVLVQAMPLLVAHGHKLSGNARVVLCFKENGAV